MAGIQVAKLRRQSLEPSGETRARQTRVFGACIVLLLLAFVIGVRYFANQKRALNTSADVRSQGLYFRLSMRKSTYRPGEPIDIQLLVSNVSSSPIKLQFDNDLEYDLTVQRDQDIVIAQVPQTIWQLSKNSGHILRYQPHSIEIAAGQSRTFEAVWPQKDYRGQSVDPGRYTILGGLLARDRNEQLKLRGATNQ